MSFDQLIAAYRDDDPERGVRPPDMRDVVRRAHRHRRRQVAGSLVTASLVVTGGVVGIQALSPTTHTSPPVALQSTSQGDQVTKEFHAVALDLEPASGAPHYLAKNRLDMPVSFGVAGKDALWFLGQKTDGWHLEKVEAPTVTATLGATVAGEPVALAATDKYIWVAEKTAVLQLDAADGSVVHSYTVDGSPIGVQAVQTGTAYVTETVPGGMRVLALDGAKHAESKRSAVIPGIPGTPATLIAFNRIYVNTSTTGDHTVTALSRNTLAPVVDWSVDLGTSAAHDIAYTDPLFFADPDGDHVGLWEAPFDGKSEPTPVLHQVLTAPTYKVSTTHDHAWALSSTGSGSVLSRYDYAAGTVGFTLPTDVPADQVTTMVADAHYVWLVAGDTISVYGPS